MVKNNKRKLERLLLINWFEYQHEIIEFDDITFLTGKNGSGKSTIIDALQLVLQGDTDYRGFNKAANGNSKRKLNGYLFGDLGENENGSARYLRTKPFTSYVVLEFYNERLNSHFTVGFVADCKPVLNRSHIWFISENYGIPDNHFLNDNVPMTISEMREYLMSHYPNDEWKFYTSNKGSYGFQESELSVFGCVEAKYREYLSNAVKFNPEIKIKEFITNAICNTNDKLDLSRMQREMDELKKAQKLVFDTEEKIKLLEEISEAYRDYVCASENVRKADYAIYKLNWNIVSNAAERDRLKIDRCDNQMLLAIGDKNEALQRIEEYKRRRDEKIEARGAEHLSYIRKDLEQKKENINREIIRIENIRNHYIENLNLIGSEWSDLLSRMVKVNPDFSSFNRSVFEVLTNVKEENLLEFDYARAVNEMNNIKSELDDIYQEIEGEYKEASESFHKYNELLEGIEVGEKPHSISSEELMEYLKDNLSEYLEPEDGIYYLCDLFEINNNNWRYCIEAFLGNNRELIVVPEYLYDKALSLLNGILESDQYPSAGLLDIALNSSIEKSAEFSDSIFTIVSSDNKYVNNYLYSVFGNMLMASSVDEVICNDSSLSANGFLHYNGAISMLDLSLDPIIGVESLRLLEESYKRMCLKAQSELASLSLIRGLLKEAHVMPVPTINEIKKFQEDRQFIDNLSVYKQRLEELDDEYKSYDFSYIDKINCDIKELDDCIYRHNELVDNLDKEINKLQLEKNKAFDSMHNEQSLMTEFQENLKTFRDDEVSFCEAYFASACPNIANASEAMLEPLSQKRFVENKNAATFRDRMIQCRAFYNSKYNSEEFNVGAENNDQYESILNKLKDSELLDYKDKLTDSENKAYLSFCIDFIGEIREKISGVEDQVSKLNSYLEKFSMGPDKYSFVVKPNKAYKKYYDMFKSDTWVPKQDDLIFDENVALMEQMNELYQMIVIDDSITDDHEREEKLKTVNAFKDYKTYLTFDLYVTRNGVKQSLTSSYEKKSGGETQSPLYIALLAAISNVCHSLDDDGFYSNTIRLVIFDEAFSKLDKERIKASIELLRSYNLQAIFSAPEEKVQAIMPYSDKTLVAYHDENGSCVELFDLKKDDNRVYE